MSGIVNQLAFGGAIVTIALVVISVYLRDIRRELAKIAKVLEERDG